MCFAVHPDHTQRMTATEDIKCFKTYNPHTKVDGEVVLISTFRGHVVKVGDHYYLPEAPHPGDRVRYMGGIAFPDVNSINKGFHSYTGNLKVSEGIMHAIEQNSVSVWVECTIPKGTIYYVNPHDGHYVSQAIYIKRILDTKKYKDEIYKYSEEKVNLEEL